MLGIVSFKILLFFDIIIIKCKNSLSKLVIFIQFLCVMIESQTFQYNLGFYQSISLQSRYGGYGGGEGGYGRLYKYGKKFDNFVY